MSSCRHMVGYRVNAESGSKLMTKIAPAGRVGDNAEATDSHGCPQCPHSVSGPLTEGSPDVLINGRAAARKRDAGSHSSCCGSNTFHADDGASTVLFNNKPAHRKGDRTVHCGGRGVLIEGSDNVLIGEPKSDEDVEKSWIGLKLTDAKGNAVAGVKYRIVLPDGTQKQGILDDSGTVRVEQIDPGVCQIFFPDLGDDEWE